MGFKSVDCYILIWLNLDTGIQFLLQFCSSEILFSPGSGFSWSLWEQVLTVMTWREKHSLEHSDINLNTFCITLIEVLCWRGVVVNIGYTLKSPWSFELPSLMLAGPKHPCDFSICSHDWEPGWGAVLKLECASESPRTVLNHRSLGPTLRICDSVGLRGEGEFVRLVCFQVVLKLMGDHSLRTTGREQNNKNVRVGSKRTC